MNRFRNLGKGREGFTLVEIMIVVLIIGILLAIAVPNFVTARENSRSRSCVANLKQIESAKEQWAMATRAANNATPTNGALSPEYVRVFPTCPSNGAYTIGSMENRPTCDVAGHVLP